MNWQGLADRISMNQVWTYLYAITVWWIIILIGFGWIFFFAFFYAIGASGKRKGNTITFDLYDLDFYRALLLFPVLFPLQLGFALAETQRKAVVL